MIIRDIAAQIDRVVVGLHYATVARHHAELEPLADAVGIEEREQFWDLAEFLVVGACTTEIARRRFPYDSGDDAAVMFRKLREGLYLDDAMRPNAVLHELASTILAAQAETAEEVWPGDLSGVQVPADQAYRAADGPLVDAFRALPVPDAPGHRLLHTLTGVRYGRHDAHIDAWASFGLSGLDVVALGSAVNGEVLAEVPAALLESGWVDCGGNLTAAGREARLAIESKTDEGCRSMYDAVGELSSWYEALRAMPGQV